MLGPRLRFIDLATRPLAGKGAAEDLARGEMMDRLAHAKPAEGDDSLGNLSEHFMRAPLRSPRKDAGIFFSIFLLLVGLFLIFRSGLIELERLGAFSHRGFNRDSVQILSKGLDSGQKQFLFGNTIGISDKERLRTREERMEHPPQDLGEFEEDAACFLGTGREFPQKLREHGEKIDQGNGLWALAEASEIKWADLTRRGSRFPASALPPEYERAVALLERAAEQPRIQTILPRRTAERLRLLGPPRDIAEMEDREHFSEMQRRLEVAMSGADTLWVFRAEELARGGKKAELRKWLAAWEKVTLEGLRQTPDRRNISVSIYSIQRTAELLENQAREGDLPDEEARLAKWRTEAGGLIFGYAPRVATAPHPPMTANGDWIYQFPDLVAERELMPGRRAEYALADRFTALGAAAMFGILVLFAGFEGWRRHSSVKGLAAGLGPLLKPVDFLWVAGLGFFLPLSWYIGVCCFSPMGCRALGLLAWHGVPTAFGAVGSFLFSACMMLQTARWRLARRGGLLGLRPRALWPGWVMAGLAGILVLGPGVVRYLPKWHEQYLAGLAAAAGLPLLWLLWRGFALLFCPRHAALEGVMICRMLLPCFFGASVCLLGLAPLLKIEERKWVALDQVGGADPAGSGKSLLNARAENLMREQLLKAME